MASTMKNRLGMYSEVELSKDEEDTLVDSARGNTSPIIPLSRLRRRDVPPPSVWTSLRIWMGVRLARLSAWITP